MEHDTSVTTLQQPCVWDTYQLAAQLDEKSGRIILLVAFLTMMPMSRCQVDSMSENELMKTEQKWPVYCEPARTSTGNRRFALHLCLYMPHASFLTFLFVLLFCLCPILCFLSLFFCFLFLTLRTTFFLPFSPFLSVFLFLLSVFIFLYVSFFLSLFLFSSFFLSSVLSFLPTFCLYYFCLSLCFSVFLSVFISFEGKSHTDQILGRIYFYSDME